MSDIVTLNGYKIKDEKAVRSYENVAQMKADTKLKEGYHVKTKGYYEANDGGHGEYVIVNDDTLVDDGGSIHVLTSGLRAKLIIENDTINSIQFGCKRNDDTFDNGVKFNTLFNKANEKGLNVIIQNGNYYVSTPIIINEKLYAITIDGLNPSSNLNGTKLIYTGDGYCLTLAKGGLKYTIKNIAIECNGNNSGINCNGVINTVINFKNYLTNISVSSAIIGMKIVASTYTMIDNYTFGGHANTEVGLYIEGYEFTYINNSSIDGYSLTDSNSIALKLDGGLNYYINNLDLCNFGDGKAIYMTNDNFNLYTVYYNNINVIRCDGGIVTECGTRGAINSISFDNTLIALTGTKATAKYFYSIPNSSSIMYFDIRNLTIRNLAQTTLPDYIYEQASGGIFSLLLEIKDLYFCPISKSGIKGGTTDRYTYKNYTTRNQGMKYINTDGTTTQYTLSLDWANQSNKPFINIYVRGHNDYTLSDPSYNTTTGKLETTITFSTAPSQGNIRVAYTISDCGAGS